jgi:hypothetical protein
MIEPPPGCLRCSAARHGRGHPEYSNPTGLRMDEPVTDPLTQYKHDLRQELIDFPQDLDSQFAAQAIMTVKHLVPPAETIDVIEEPPPPPPVLASIEPSTGEALNDALGTLTVTGTGFLADDVVLFAGLSLETTVASDTSITCPIPVGAAAGPVSVVVSAIVGESNPLTFTYTDPPPDPEARVMEVPKDAVTPSQPVAPARAATAPLIGER